MLFCYGAGFLGSRVLAAASNTSRALDLACSTRSASRASSLRANLPALTVCTSGASSSEAIASSSLFLTTAPPDPATNTDPALTSISHALMHSADSGVLQCIALTSTTSVYGNHNGKIVDELSETVSSSSRFEQEHRWCEFVCEHLGVSLLIFRVAGLYGPGRSALSSKSTPSNRSKRQRKRFTSRVHVDDAANAITSGLITSIEDQWNISKERLDRVRVYNLVDDDPSPRAAVEQYASWLRGRASQPELEGKFLPSDLSDEEKVVDNARAKSELGWKLMYPTFREGLEAIANLEISE